MLQKSAFAFPYPDDLCAFIGIRNLIMSTSSVFVHGEQ